MTRDELINSTIEKAEEEYPEKIKDVDDEDEDKEKEEDTSK